LLVNIVTKIPKHKFVCPICSGLWRKNQNSIKCDGCQNWIHAPPKKCSNLDYNEFLYYTRAPNESQWYCPICLFSHLPDASLELSDEFLNISENAKTVCDENLKHFINSCQNKLLDINLNFEDDENTFTNINSKYYDLHEIKKLKNDLTSLGILHTNLASIYKYHDDLELILSLIKVKFQIIGITEHKITGNTPLSNIKLAGYHDFIYNETQTTHGGSGFYVNESLVYIRRNDLILKPYKPGEFESTFIEIILPNKTNIVLGCIYRHPSSSIMIEDFTTNYLEPVLNIISAENKICAIMGDFNIDLLKCNIHDDINYFYNSFLSNFFAPYILQPTRPISKSLIDNIFMNTIEYETYCGNLTI